MLKADLVGRAAQTLASCKVPPLVTSCGFSETNSRAAVKAASDLP